MNTVYIKCTRITKALILGLNRAPGLLNSFIFSYMKHNNLARHTKRLFWMRNLWSGLCLGSCCSLSFQKRIREGVKNHPGGHQGQGCWHTAAPSGWWFFFEPGEELIHNFET